MLDADRPDSELMLVRERTEGIEYGIDHQGERLLIGTNDGAKDFRLVEAPLPTLADAPEGAQWRELIGARPGIRLEDIDCFEDFVVISERRTA